VARLIRSIDKRTAPQVAAELRNFVAVIAKDLDYDLEPIATAIAVNVDRRNELLHLADALRRAVSAAAQDGRRRREGRV